MPPIKIQPIDSPTYRESSSIRIDAAKPVLKSRLKRLFDLQLPNVLRISSAEKPMTAGEKDGGAPATEVLEPSSVCLAKMVQNFIEESNEKQTAALKCGRNRCNCFNGNVNDISDDEFGISFGDSVPSGWVGDFSDTIKSLIQCASVTERNLLADTSKIVEENKMVKRKVDLLRILVDGLLFLGYDASICKSRWEKSASYPAGEYEYIDVISGDERVLIDIDFKSEFEIARPTSSYKAIIQSLPFIFVGKADRLQQVVNILSEAAKQSLKKKGLHIPPWRKPEYMRAKWLSSHVRTTSQNDVVKADTVEDDKEDCDCGELDLIFGENVSLSSSPPEKLFSGVGEVIVASPWRPPAVKPKSCDGGGGRAVITGLASLFKEKA